MRAINKHSTNPKIWSVETPNAPYLNRYQQAHKKSQPHILHIYFFANTQVHTKKIKE